MNSKQAKAEPLPEFLGRMGFEPAHIRGNDVWYRSPFRPDERTPSFKIDRLKNVWYDHGMGAGGTIIDLVQQLHGTLDMSRTLATIADILGNPTPPQRVSQVAKALERAPAPRAKEPPRIESIGEIADRHLEAYLASRAIPVDLARLYLKEVAYQVDGNPYRALGFPNDAGGFEVRNASFKGSLGTKDISYLPKPASRQAAVFEGFFDFLSVLAHYRKDRANANVLVLNSLALFERGVNRLQTEQIRKVHAYLDQDKAGRDGLARLQAIGLDTETAQSPWEVVDASGLYTGFKDANEFLA